MPQGLFLLLCGKPVETRIFTMFSLKSQFAIYRWIILEWPDMDLKS